MFRLNAVRAFALIGSLALFAFAGTAAAQESVNLTDLFTGSHDQGYGQHSVPHASSVALLGGDISGVHVLTGANEKWIDFRPSGDGEWDVYLWDNKLGWIHAADAWLNYAGEVLVEGDNGIGTGAFTCQAGGGWAWTVSAFGKKVGSGTMT